MKTAVRQTVTPVLDTGAYASGDQMGALLNAPLSDPLFGSELVTVTVLDKAEQSLPLDIFLFDRSVTVAADQAAASFSDGDMEYLIGVINILAGDYDDGGPNSVATINVEPYLPLVASSRGRQIYIALVSRGAPTYAAGSLVVTFNVNKGVN